MIVEKYCGDVSLLLSRNSYYVILDHYDFFSFICNSWKRILFHVLTYDLINGFILFRRWHVAVDEQRTSAALKVTTSTHSLFRQYPAPVCHPEHTCANQHKNHYQRFFNNAHYLAYDLYHCFLFIVKWPVVMKRVVIMSRRTRSIIT